MITIKRQARSSNLAWFRELLNMIDNARNNENNEEQRGRNDDDDNDEVGVWWDSYCNWVLKFSWVYIFTSHIFFLDETWVLTVLLSVFLTQL